MRCDGMRCDAMRRDAMRYAVRCDVTRCDAMRSDAWRCEGEASGVRARPPLRQAGGVAAVQFAGAVQRPEPDGAKGHSRKTCARLGLRVPGSGFQVQGFRFRVSG